MSPRDRGCLWCLTRFTTGRVQEVFCDASCGDAWRACAPKDRPAEARQRRQSIAETRFRLAQARKRRGIVRPVRSNNHPCFLPNGDPRKEAWRDRMSASQHRYFAERVA